MLVSCAQINDLLVSGTRVNAVLPVVSTSMVVGRWGPNQLFVASGASIHECLVSGVKTNGCWSVVPNTMSLVSGINTTDV